MRFFTKINVIINVAVLVFLCSCVVANGNTPIRGGLTAPTAVEKPTISVSCKIADVVYFPEIPARVTNFRWTWTTQNSTHVLIEGFGTAKYKPNGFIEKVGGGNLTFIAVGPGGITRVVSSATLSVSQAVDGTGDYMIDRSFNSETFFKYGYTDKFTYSGSLSRIKDTITRLLQKRKYTIDVNIFPSDKSLILETRGYEYHKLLCDGDDCKRPIGKRRIQRQVAFSMYIQIVSKSTCSITIQPSVLMRYRREEGDWYLDKDGRHTANPVCEELVKELATAVRKR